MSVQASHPARSNPTTISVPRPWNSTHDKIARLTGIQKKNADSGGMWLIASISGVSNMRQVVGLGRLPAVALLLVISSGGTYQFGPQLPIVGQVTS